MPFSFCAHDADSVSCVEVKRIEGRSFAGLDRDTTPGVYSDVASEKYKGYRISGWTLVKHSAREDLCSRGTVSILTKVGSIIEVQQLEGPAFHNKKEAEEHGLQLCKEWIDRLKRPRVS